MVELFKGWMGTVVLVAIAVLSCDLCLGPPIKPIEKPKTVRVIYRIAKGPWPGPWIEPLPMHPQGHPIVGDGVASGEILIGFTIDEQGLATDKQVETQLIAFSMSEVAGWTQHDGWYITVGLSSAEILTAMKIQESHLPPTGSWNGACHASRRISPSYRMNFDFHCDLPAVTRISFSRDRKRESNGTEVAQREAMTD